MRSALKFINTPDCKHYRKFISDFSVEAGICESVDDVKHLPTRVSVILRKKQNSCKGCEKSFSPFENKEVDAGSGKACKGRCRTCAAAGQTLCGSAFRKLRCRVACSTAVEYLLSTCEDCCEGAGFYKNCIEPFSHILDFIGIPCDPAWD